MRVTIDQAENTVAEIFDLYAQHGEKDYIGEPVSQVEHMSQAAMLAKSEGYDNEVVLAAFFHDIGHLCADDATAQMDGFGVKDHEAAGAGYLRKRGFSGRLIKLVKSHVAAKRYLTYKVAGYYEQLSEASKATLAFQGGPMDAPEALALETDPDFDLILRFRYWDDQAKLTDIPVNNLAELKIMAVQHLLQN